MALSRSSRAHPASLSLMRNPVFALLAGSVGVSRLGDACYTLALPWLVYDMTGSSAAMGSVFFMEMMPLFFAYPLAGVIVDRVNKRTLIMVTDIVRMLLVVLVPLLHVLGLLQLWQVLVLAPLMTTLSITFNLALNSATPLLIPEGGLVQANSALQSINSAADLLGPVLAGFVIAKVGAVPALLIDSVSFGATVLAALRFRINDVAASGIRSIKEAISLAFGGVQYLLQHRVIRDLATYSFINNIANGAILALLVYVLRSRGLDAQQSGFVFAMMGASSLVAALAVGRFARRFTKGSMLITGLALNAIGTLLVAVAPGFSWLLVGAFVYQGPMILFNVVNQTLRQEMVPGEYLGRVTATNRMLAQFCVPIAGFVAGLVLEKVDPTPMLLGATAIQVVAAVGAFFSSIRTVK